MVTYVNNENTQEAHFLVMVLMDTKSPTLEVAAVKLPRRLPQGFHSIVVTEVTSTNSESHI